MSPLKKILMVIDDEEEILFTLKEFLMAEGYEVLTATNGFEALNILKSGVIPNLILLDMKMPIMNGWAFALEFLSRHDHMSPIVVMTAAGDAEQRAKDISAIGWIEKPFDLNILLKTVQKYERKTITNQSA
jgi:DNA-binding response OmpR family regulator